MPHEQRAGRLAQQHELFDLEPGEFHFRTAGHFTYGCPCGCGQARVIPIDGTRGWRWDGNADQPTITPSIRHLDRCKWHGFITGGVWLPCSDSGS